MGVCACGATGDDDHTIECARASLKDEIDSRTRARIPEPQLERTLEAAYVVHMLWPDWLRVCIRNNRLCVDVSADGRAWVLYSQTEPLSDAEATSIARALLALQVPR